MSYAVITIYGIVQGVGFRPFVSRIAEKYHLKGRVYNTTGSVIIEVSGEKKNINDFCKAVRAEKPPAARISRLTIKYLSSKKKFDDFSISSSKPRKESKIVPPDLKICDECKKELLDKSDRRYHYPFINCTNCGPRFSIILNTPYDRKNTTMNKFRMCEKCSNEYRDINNRRYHAEPNACPECGPEIFLKGRDGDVIKGEKALISAKTLLKKGKIIAIKGIGGYHIACDATSDKAVLKLKRNKKRSDKPLAVMIETPEKIRKIAFVSGFEEKLLKSAAAPIVLLLKKNNNLLSGEIARDLDRIGVFLPYTPLHCLLFDDEIFALVMTSGNVAEEPIQYVNKECFVTLNGIVDYFLYHDRDINIPVDDS
ncbi:MAG TPA: Sua5/YciO/YrdC/YwlC family protein, partial [Candidatus Goldiibacteriota bacterium]|nr:Sua5/YciO/YrdC/YwlC family protein [Candidatus Goldiibacteriota bacterium]